jgi:hypothetical protein
MNTVDRVTKEVKIVVDSAKDSTLSNVIKYIRENSLQLTDNQVSGLINLIGISIDEGYQRSVTTFQNSVKKFV